MTCIFQCAPEPDPTYLHAVNVVSVYAILLFCGRMFYYAMPLPRWEIRWFVPAFTLSTLCLYRWHDQFLQASLQEKLVLAAGALAIWLIHTTERRASLSSHLRDSAAIIAALLLGMATKAQFLMFLPGLFLMLLAKDARSSSWKLFKLGLFICVSLAGMIFIKWVASQGIYTANSYSLARVPTSLWNRTTLLMIAVALGSILFEARRAHKSGLGWPGLFRAAVPGTILLAFLTIMAPWGLGDSYIISPATPIVALCVLSAFQSWPERKTMLPLVFVAVFALALTGYRCYRGMGRWSDLRKLIFSDELRAYAHAQPPVTLFMSCMEGSDLTRIYLRRYNPESLLEIIYRPEDAKNERIVTIADSALCPFRPDLFPGTFEMISKPRFNGSFTLYELRR